MTKTRNKNQTSKSKVHNKRKRDISRRRRRLEKLEIEQAYDRVEDIEEYAYDMEETAYWEIEQDLRDADLILRHSGLPDDVSYSWWDEENYLY